jgi:hypothetical protein
MAALLLTRSWALLHPRISQKAESTVLSASDKRDIKREVKKLEVSCSHASPPPFLSSLPIAERLDAGVSPISGVRERDVDGDAVSQDSIKKKQDKAAKLEKSVEKEEEALKNKVVAAKKEREQGNKLERRARGKVHDVDKMRDEAVKLEKEAQAARAKFLAAEKPVELATKLATHDHQVYRKAELAVAKEVVKLSERPNDSKLHAEVDKLVKKSKNAKAKMEGDGTMLKTLENRAGDSKFDGEWSYSRLSQKSVDVAKDAKHLARHAERQAEEGHKDRYAPHLHVMSRQTLTQ